MNFHLKILFMTENIVFQYPPFLFIFILWVNINKTFKLVFFFLLSIDSMLHYRNLIKYFMAAFRGHILAFISVFQSALENMSLK